jgi:hypothetical protein
MLASLVASLDLVLEPSLVLVHLVVVPELHYLNQKQFEPLHLNASLVPLVDFLLRLRHLLVEKTHLDLILVVPLP